MRVSLLPVIVGFAGLVHVLPVYAAQELILASESSQLLTMTGTPGTVVVGNPAIADVSVSGKQVFVHGHSPGETNLLILDHGGNPIVNFDLVVTNAASHSVTMFMGSVTKGQMRGTYSCAPNCETSMTAGDTPGFTNDVIKGNSARSDFATGKKSTDVKAPQAPQ